MKAIVIFYSFEGNTKLIAKTIDADLLELKPEKEMKSKGFMKYVWGAKAAMMKTKPKLLPFEKNILDYDILFIGTPVWAWTYAPPLNTFFTTHSPLNKKVALFCCHGGGKGKTFNKMEAALKNNKIVGKIDFQDPLKHDTDKNIQKVKEWAAKIIEEIEYPISK